MRKFLFRSLLALCLIVFLCHPERGEGPALAFAFALVLAFVSLICHPRRGSAFALALAFLSVILGEAEDLLLPELSPSQAQGHTRAPAKGNPLPLRLIANPTEYTPHSRRP